MTLVGRTFGRLTVLAQGVGRQCLCECCCGNLHWARADNLRAGKIKSCGCLKSDVLQARTRRETRRGATYVADESWETEI